MDKDGERYIKHALADCAAALATAEASSIALTAHYAGLGHTPAEVAARLHQLQGRGTAGDAAATAAETEYAAAFEVLRTLRCVLERELARHVTAAAARVTNH